MSSTDLPVVDVQPAAKPQATIVVRYGCLRTLAELPFDGEVRPGCGSKVVLRTKRGTELADVISTTANCNCPLNISRDKLMAYIEASGGVDYPFVTEGKVLRVANSDDLKQQQHIDAEKPRYISSCRELVREMQLPMKLVDVELILGGEMTTFYFLSESRVDFRILVKQLAAQFRTRIQMHQVGARDEARLVADFETCGQHCCCKQFLKVLKPISMGSAKMQKATLDPSKISGRCGRLKCCLRYEELTYQELRKKLPRIGTRVRTSEGLGTVEETMIITQLVKVRLESDKFVVVANEQLLSPDAPAPPAAPAAPAAARPRPEAVEARPPRTESRRPPQRKVQQADTDSVEEQEQSPQEQNVRGRPGRNMRGRPARPPSQSQQPISPPTNQASRDIPLPVQPDVGENDQALDDGAPAQPQSGAQPQGVGAMGRRRRRRRGRGRGNE